MPIDFTFARRENPDHTIDLICELCFQTVVTTKSELDLIRGEQEHCCDPRIDPSVFQEEPRRRPRLL